MSSIRSKFCRFLAKRLIGSYFDPKITIDEMLLDDSRSVADIAKQVGVDVTIKIYEDMWHFFHVFYKLMPEAKTAVKEIGVFIRKNFS